MRTTMALATALALATSVLLLPGAAAAPLKTSTISVAPEGDADLLGSCSRLVAGSNFCTFTCVRESTVVVSFIGTGSVKGFCVGAAAACAALGACSAESLTRVTANSVGVCLMSGAGLGACGS